jgi:hypothetical protein
MVNIYSQQCEVQIIHFIFFELINEIILRIQSKLFKIPGVTKTSSQCFRTSDADSYSLGHEIPDVTETECSSPESQKSATVPYRLAFRNFINEYPSIYK